MNLNLKASDNLFTVLEKLKLRGEGGQVDLTIPNGSPLLNNLLTLKILKKEANKLGVKLELETDDPRGQNLLNTLAPTPASAPAAGPIGGMGFKEGVDVSPPTSADVGGEKSGLNLLKIFKSPGFKKFLLFSGVGLTGLGAIFALLWTVPKATVRLTVRSENLVRSFELTASPSATAIDQEKRILPAVLIEVEEKGEQKAEATGKKEKGTKAEGEITIYNWTDDEKTFPRDTAVTLIRIEGEKLKFLLDEELILPPQTASVSSTPEERTTTYTPGKEDARVTAEKFGEEYNVETDSQFSIAGLSTDSFLGQNSANFEGGKKEEVTIVSSEDQNRLLQKLKEELEGQARKDIKSRAVGDQKLDEEAIAYEILGQTFDKEVDEETEEFKLFLRLKGSALVYSQTQLNTLVSELLKDSVPEDFDLSDKDLTTEAGAARMVEDEEGEKMLQIIAKVRASVVSKVDEEKIKEGLTGRSLDSAQEYLESVPGVSAVEISIFPPLPGPLTRMPRLASRIEFLLKHN